VELREFAAESLDEATEKAAKHFGVSTDRVELSVLSEQMQISGAGGRVVVLATIREEPPQVGPTGQFVLGVLERMGLEGGVQLEEYQEEGEITVRIHGAGVQNLLRRDRRVHGALTHLANRAAQKLVQPDVAVRVETESGGGGEDRLEEMARSRAREARSSGREVVLPPMDSRERWIVHNTLKTVSGIRTESVGAGRLKRVKILPA
jgi:spoIIIJ-associated protein